MCFIIPIIVSFVIGWINGWIVAKFKVLSFITTLGMSTVLSGIIIVCQVELRFLKYSEEFFLAGNDQDWKNPVAFRYDGCGCCNLLVSNETYRIGKKTVCNRW